MKDLISISMILSVMLGFVGVGRLCWDSKWFVILLFLYTLGAFATLSMVAVMMSQKGGNVRSTTDRPELKLRPSENQWIVRAKNSHSFHKIT